jgi:hypothetical protein
MTLPLPYAVAEVEADEDREEGLLVYDKTTGEVVDFRRAVLGTDATDDFIRELLVQWNGL